MGNSKMPIKSINLQEFTVHQTIGLSKLSRIRLVSRKEDNTITPELSVWKIICKDEAISLSLVDKIKNEIVIHSMLVSHFTTKFYGFAQTPGHLYLNIELCPGGSLFDLIRQNGKLSLDLSKFILLQVAIALEYLHNKKIIYRDLKPENILFMPDGYIKITDFGISKIIKDKTYTICGTTRYLAPEIILLWLEKSDLIYKDFKIVKNEAKSAKVVNMSFPTTHGYNFLADYWSLGILFYEMLHGIDPFADLSDIGVKEKILSGKLRIDKEFNIQTVDFITKLLSIKPSKRLGSKNQMNEVYEHKLFENISINKIRNKSLVSPYIPNQDDLISLSSKPKFSEKERVPKKLNPQDDPFLNWDLLK